MTCARPHSYLLPSKMKIFPIKALFRNHEQQYLQGEKVPPIFLKELMKGRLNHWIILILSKKLTTPLPTI